jgi:hypothetical protein
VIYGLVVAVFALFVLALVGAAALLSIEAKDLPLPESEESDRTLVVVLRRRCPLCGTGGHDRSRHGGSA